MRFARLRDNKGKDIHIWVDDGFNEDAANLVISMLKVVVEAEKRMGMDAIEYVLSDLEYVETDKIIVGKEKKA